MNSLVFRPCMGRSCKVSKIVISSVLSPFIFCEKKKEHESDTGQHAFSA